MARVIYLVEMVVWNPTTRATETLRYCTGRGYVTGPAETPANTFYAPRVQQPAAMRRDLFGGNRLTGRSRAAYGDLELLNGDGALDFLSRYGLDGRAVTIRRGEQTAAYPSGFTTVLVAQMESVEVGREIVTVRLRDAQRELDVPLQTTKYAGTNVLPAGLEGVAGDLQGSPKPFAFGNCTNVPAVCVNTSKLIYQVHDGPIFRISDVYDRGVPLRGADFTAEDLDSVSGKNIEAMCATPNGVLVVAGGTATADNVIDYRASASAAWATSDTSGMGGNNVAAIAYGTGKYVALSGDVQYVYTTTDPAGPWTAVSVHAGIGVHNAEFARYVNGRFFVAWKGTGVNQTIVKTSTDASVWTTITVSPFTDGLPYVTTTTPLYSVAYGAGVYVAVGHLGALSYSTDASAWTAIPSITRNALYDVWYDESATRFVTVGAGGFIATSSDGLTWEIPDVTQTDDLHAVTYGAGKWTAVGAASGAVLYSTDAKNWYQLTSPFGADDANAVLYDQNKLYAGGDSGKLYGTTGGVAEYSSNAALLDDAQAPDAGAVKAWSSGGYFRIGSVPAGEITADIQQGATAGNRTAGQFFVEVVGRAGVTDYTSADVVALDAANDAELGYWTTDEVECGEVLDDVARTVGAWWGVDKDGSLRIQQLAFADTSGSTAFNSEPILGELVRTTSDNGIPVYEQVLLWGRVYAVQTDVAGAATDERRALVAREWRRAVATDPWVQVGHPLATQRVDATLFTDRTDAETEAARLLGLFSAPQDVFDLTVPLTDQTEDLDLGDTIWLSHDRYGLANGRLFIIVTVEPDYENQQVRLRIWGSSYDYGRVAVAPTLSGSGSSA